MARSDYVCRFVIHASSTMTRTRTERIMRYMLRRKPCVVLVIAECITILAFTVMMFTLVTMLLNAMNERRHINDGSRIKDELSSKINLWSCAYKIPPRNVADFFTETCESGVGEDAVSIAVQTAMNPNQCADVLYEVKCHEEAESLRRQRNVTELIPTACAGLHGAPMPYELVSSELNVLAPRINNKDLDKLMHYELFVSELLLKCPRCRVLSKYYSAKEDNAKPDQICRRQLQTIGVGWPTHAEYCDEEELSTVDIAERIYC